MHEASLVQALLDRIDAEARARGATSVSRVRVALGEASGVERELFEIAYRTFRERTICAAAELEVIAVPVRWECPDCGNAVLPGQLLRCAECGRPARMAAGDELILERIEMEVA
jgi:hydrogenase nickel incorporation protein HypA/HybF